MLPGLDLYSSSSSSMQQRRRRGSGGGQLRASEPHIGRLMTPCLGGYALTYASARGVHTHKVNGSLNTLHTAEATTAHRIFAVAADRPNNSSSSTRQRLPRGSRGGQLRASEFHIIRLMTSCLGGCAMFLSRVVCVVCRLCCVTCALCCLLAVSCYNT